MMITKMVHKMIPKEEWRLGIWFWNLKNFSDEEKWILEGGIYRLGVKWRVAPLECVACFQISMETSIWSNKSLVQASENKYKKKL